MNKFIKKLGSSSCGVLNEQENGANESDNITHEYVTIDDEINNNVDENVTHEDVNIENENYNYKDYNVAHENENRNEQFISPLDIYDPINWENLDNKLRDILIEKGPIRESNLDYPKDKISRHFAYASYTRKYDNGETSDRNWLVYSKKS